MSYQPYTTGNNNTQKNSSSYNPYQNASGSSPAPASASNYNPYENIPKTTTAATAQSDYNPYQNVASTPAPAAASSYNPYGAPSNTTTTPASSSYNPYENIPKASATVPTSTTSRLPDFCNALDVPPPTNISATYYTTSTKGKDGSSYGTDATPVATAYPMGTGGQQHGSSLVSSTTYQGGPTGGIVSEGNPVKCHKVDYEIKGHEMQLVEIELDPGETVIGEAGGMMFLEDGIKFEAKFGDGSEPKQSFWKKLLAAGGRLLTGESLFVTHFTNESQRKARVAFAAPYPGNIVPLNLANLGGSITCQRDAFLCAALGTKISLAFNKRIGSGLFGGEGFILQKMQGDGMAFMHAGGTIIRRELNNERIRLDTGCLVAFTSGISFEVQFAPGLKTALFGGEGLFLAVLHGTGTVWMQSLPFSRMADRIIQSAPSAGGKRVGEGSMLTGRFGDLVNGDGF